MSFSCVVCQELVTRDPEGGAGGQQAMEIVALPCGHIYHKICIDTWFTTSGSRECCTCKVPVTAEMRKIYPNGTAESDNIEKLNEENKKLAKRIADLKIQLKSEKELNDTRIAALSILVILVCILVCILAMQWRQILELNLASRTIKIETIDHLLKVLSTLRAA